MSKRKRNELSGVFVFAAEEAARIAPPTYTVNGESAEFKDSEWSLHEAAIRNVDKGIFSRRLSYITGAQLHAIESDEEESDINDAVLMAIRAGLEEHGIQVHEDSTRYKYWVLEGACASANGLETFETEAAQALKTIEPVCIVQEHLKHCFPISDLKDDLDLEGSVDEQNLEQMVYHAITLTPEMAWKLQRQPEAPPIGKAHYQIDRVDHPLDGVAWMLAPEDLQQVNTGVYKSTDRQVTGNVLHEMSSDDADIMNNHVRQALLAKARKRGLYIADDDRTFEYLVFASVSSTLTGQTKAREQIETTLEDLKPLATVREKFYYENMELHPGEAKTTVERRLLHVLQIPPEDTRVLRAVKPTRRLTDQMRYSVDGIEFFPYTAEFDLDDTMIAQANLGVCRKARTELTGLMLHGKEKFENGVLNKNVSQALRNRAEDHGINIEPDDTTYKYRTFEGVSVSLSGQKRLKKEVEYALKGKKYWGVVKEKFFHFDVTFPSGHNGNLEHRIYHVIIGPDA